MKAPIIYLPTFELQKPLFYELRRLGYKYSILTLSINDEWDVWKDAGSAEAHPYMTIFSAIGSGYGFFKIASRSRSFNPDKDNNIVLVNSIRHFLRCLDARNIKS